MILYIFQLLFVEELNGSELFLFLVGLGLIVLKAYYFDKMYKRLDRSNKLEEKKEESERKECFEKIRNDYLKALFKLRFIRSEEFINKTYDLGLDYSAATKLYKKYDDSTEIYEEEKIENDVISAMRGMSHSLKKWDIKK